MRSAAIVVLLLAAFCEARPNLYFDARPFFGSSYIYGAVDATPGEFPHQLSQQQQFGSAWRHNCGASLLSATRVLSAAHCIDGQSASVLRVIAGLQLVNGDGVIANVASYVIYPTWGARTDATFSDDIAILYLATSIAANGDNIQYAKLPADNSDLFTGKTGFISGWGRTETTNSPQVLKKAAIGVIDKDRCNQLLSSIQGAKVDNTQICLYDEATKAGACSGDSGGPFNLNGVVAGVTSWGISGFFGCVPTYPSVYTRVSAYLTFISANL